ncbi:sialidase family protein [Kribbella sp. NPDC004536]|uniref:sialidase family protein n=1 Tax=Kribbella sp. NPDC004536 TaxID=3364106 RepID=UPI0036AE856A
MTSSTDPAFQISRRMFLGAGAAVAAGVGLAGPAFAAPDSPGGEVPFGPVVVAGQGGRTSYARAVRLGTSAPGKSRTLLATYQGGGPGFPVYRSDDDGRTWTKQSSVPAAPSGVYLQPYLYELPRAFAGFPKGTLLFACNWLGKNFGSTNIQLYASTDSGITWQFLSTVAQGGPANTTNGATPVWEPFLLLHNDNLICYYSDQRDPNFGQKLAHQTSTDLYTWGPVVDDATGTAYAERPGMTTVARLRGDLWIMTYEFGEPDDPEHPDQNNYSYHVHYRIAKDPESFRFSPDIPLVDPYGYTPNGAPVVTWSQFGGANGTIIVTGNDDQDFLINRNLGDPAAWRRFSSPMPAGYSRFTIPLEGPGDPHNRGLVFVITGAQYGKSGPVEAGIISLAG